MIGWVLRRLFRLVRLVLSLPRLALGWALEPWRREVVAISLEGSVPEEPAGRGGWVRRLITGAPPRTSRLEALAVLREAETDPEVKAVFLELDRAALPLAFAEELVAAVRAVRARGKKVAVWLDEGGAGALAVAAAADAAWAPPLGQLAVTGVRLEPMLLKGALEKVGAVAELHHVGEWKTMSDMFTRRALTPEHEDMLGWLASDLYAQLLAAAAGRKTTEEVASLLDDAPVAHETAVEQGLLDALVRPDELDARLGKLCGLERDPRVVPGALLLARSARRRRFTRVVRDPPVVAVVPLRGTIVGGDEGGRGANAPSQPLVEVLDALRDDRRIAAVVLRIDSPGGSATASDEIWRAVRRLDETRPVVASLGRVAASGGYYAAVGARRIVAHAASLTGSIGVVSGKIHLAPLVERLGIAVPVVERGARAGLLSPLRGFTDAEGQAIEREMLRFYEAFLARVAEGRKRARDEVDALARGRVYTGRQAKEKGLVDELGGLDRAIDLALELAGKPRDPRPDVVIVRPEPRRGSPLRLLSAGDERAGQLDAARAAWELLAREHVLALELTAVEGI